MKYLRLMFILLLLLGFASVGSAAISVNDPWAPYGLSNEKNLYQIYELMLGIAPGTYSHTSDLNAFQVAPGVAWTSNNAHVVESYKYAGNSQALGYNAGSGFQGILGLNPVSSVHTASYTSPNGDIPNLSAFDWVDRTAGSVDWSSNNSRDSNPDGFYHFIAFSTGIPDEYIFAFEDRSFSPPSGPSSDSDYNDLVVRVTGVRPVPEPTTLLLFGAGLLGVGLMRRRFKK
jgi:hypothetical protein